MEANKDEAANCLEKAKKAFNEFERNKKDKNKFNQALILARKSEKMYPSIDAKGFLLYLNTKKNECQSDQEVGTNNTRNGNVPDNGKLSMFLR